MAQKSRLDTGSTPVVGSSRNMRRGVWTRVQARASFWRMPPESRSARRFAEGSQAGEVEKLLAALAEVADEVDLGEELDVLVDGQVAVKAEPLRQVADPVLDLPALPDDVVAQDRGLARRGRRGARRACGSSSSCRRRRVRQGRTSPPPGPRGRASGRPPRIRTASKVRVSRRRGGSWLGRLYRACGPTRIVASAGRPGLSRPSGFPISTLTPKTSLTRSSLVWTFLGVNSASGEM